MALLHVVILLCENFSWLPPHRFCKEYLNDEVLDKDAKKTSAKPSGRTLQSDKEASFTDTMAL
jgi:hypothetical protein